MLARQAWRPIQTSHTPIEKSANLANNQKGTTYSARLVKPVWSSSWTSQTDQTSIEKSANLAKNQKGTTYPVRPAWRPIQTSQTPIKKC